MNSASNRNVLREIVKKKKNHSIYFYESLQKIDRRESNLTNPREEIKRKRGDEREREKERERKRSFNNELDQNDLTRYTRIKFRAESKLQMADSFHKTHSRTFQLRSLLITPGEIVLLATYDK